MADFLKKLNTYQELPEYLSEDQPHFSELINLFTKEDLDLFLDHIASLDMSSDNIQISNILKILSNITLLQKLDESDKIKIGKKFMSFFSDKKQDYSNVSYLWNRIHVLFKICWDVLSVDDVRLLFWNESIRNTKLSVFLSFFRENKIIDTYIDALWFELSKEKEDGFIHYNIAEDDINFLKENQDVYNLFLQILQKRTDVATRILLQWGKEWWSQSNRKKELFIESLETLTLENRILLEKITKNIITFDKKGFWRPSKKAELLKCPLFHELWEFLVEKRPDFFREILQLYDNSESFIFHESEDFFSYSILPEQVERFTSIALISKWTILSIFYQIKRSDRKNKKLILDEFIKCEKDLIEKNEEQIVVNEKKEQSRIKKENGKIRREILSICRTLKDPKFFSEKLLYLYEEHPNLFLSKEMNILKNQVRKILSDKEYFNPKLAKVTIQRKDGQTTFSRSHYMNNTTLERCLKIWSELWIDLHPYSWKFVAYLPFTFSSENFLKEIKEFQEEDIEYIVQAYSKSRDDIDGLRLFHPGNFIEICEKGYFSKLDGEALAPIAEILKDLLSEDITIIDLYFKKKIVALFWTDRLSNYLWKNFFEKSFVSFIPQSNRKLNLFNDILSGKTSNQEITNNFELWAEINKILVLNYKDKNAIKWRLNQIKNISIAVNEPPKGRAYSPTILMDETSGFHENKFYDPLLSVINYPEYVDEILEILRKTFTLNTENNQTPSYLKNFVAKYYRKTDKEEALVKLKQEIGSSEEWKKFLDWYLRRQLNRSADKIENFNLKNQILWLEGKLAMQNEKLSYYENQTLLLVEGKTDKDFLEIAYNQLYPSRNLPFNIIICWSGTGIPGVMWNYIANKDNRLIIWLTDWDDCWLRNWKENNKKWLSPFDNYIETGLNKREDWAVFNKEKSLNQRIYIKKNKKGNFYLSLLPVPIWFENLVFEDIDEKQNNKSINISYDKYDSILQWTYKEDAKVTIESLIYYDGINDLRPNTFENKKFPWWWMGIVFSWDKVWFKDAIKNRLSLIPLEVWENFRPFFDFIDEIQKGFSSQ